MSLDTVLVAVENEDDEAIKQLARTAVDIAEPAGATVIVGYVFSNGEYDTARERLKFDPDSEVTPDVVAERAVGVRRLTEQLTGRGSNTRFEPDEATAATRANCWQNSVNTTTSISRLSAVENGLPRERRFSAQPHRH